MAEPAYSSSARRTIGQHVRKNRHAGMPQDQAVAASLSEARRKGKKVPARKTRSSKSKKATRKIGGTRKQASGASKNAGRKAGGARKKAARKTTRKTARKAIGKGARKASRKTTRKTARKSR